MFTNKHRTLHIKTVNPNGYYAVVVLHDTFEEEIATCYDKVAVDLFVRGASSLGWSVYDVDRELWLCGTMDQLAPRWGVDQ